MCTYVHVLLYWCYFTCIFYAVVRQISMLFIGNKDSVFCKAGLSQWSSSRINVRRPLTPFSSHFYFGTYLFDLFWQQTIAPTCSVWTRRPALCARGGTDGHVLADDLLEQQAGQAGWRGRPAACRLVPGWRRSVHHRHLALPLRRSVCRVHVVFSQRRKLRSLRWWVGPSARRRPVSATPLFILIVSTCHL